MLLPAMRYVPTPRDDPAFPHVRGHRPAIMVTTTRCYSVDIRARNVRRDGGRRRISSRSRNPRGDVRRITDILNTVGTRYDIFTGVDDLALESLIRRRRLVAGLVCASRANGGDHSGRRRRSRRR